MSTVPHKYIIVFPVACITITEQRRKLSFNPVYVHHLERTPMIYVVFTKNNGKKRRNIAGEITNSVQFG